VGSHLAAAALAGGLLVGCGWHAGLSVPPGAHSVGVEAVRREGAVLERGLEPEMTAALSEAVVDWVGLPLVAPSEADLVVRGVVLDYRRRGGVRNRNNELLETAVLVRASAELYDRRSGTSGPVVTVQQWSGYTLEDSSSESEARRRAIRHVANTLILELFEPDGGAPHAQEPSLLE